MLFVYRALHAKQLLLLFDLALLFFQPVLATLIGWFVAMTARQSGHFFFEPKGYDHVNQASHEYKEQIKVGYNLRRKIVLMAIWVAIPAALWFAPSLGGLIQPHVDFRGFVHDVGIAWLSLGAAGLVIRVIQLCVTRNVTEGLAWGFKIITDPFMDIVLYHKAPLKLLRGQMISSVSSPIAAAH